MTNDDVDWVREVVDSAVVGRLVTVGPGGAAAISIVEFAWSSDGDTAVIDVRIDADHVQRRHLTLDPRCVFEVDEILSTVPRRWLGQKHPDADIAVLHRSVTMECEALNTTQAGGTLRLSATTIRHITNLAQDQQPHVIDTLITRLRQRRFRNDVFTAGVLNRVSRHRNR